MSRLTLIVFLLLAAATGTLSHVLGSLYGPAGSLAGVVIGALAGWPIGRIMGHYDARNL